MDTLLKNVDFNKKLRLIFTGILFLLILSVAQNIYYNEKYSASLNLLIHLNILKLDKLDKNAKKSFGKEIDEALLKDLKDYAKKKYNITLDTTQIKKEVE